MGVSQSKELTDKLSIACARAGREGHQDIQDTFSDNDVSWHLLSSRKTKLVLILVVQKHPSSTLATDSSSIPARNHFRSFTQTYAPSQRLSSPKIFSAQSNRRLWTQEPIPEKEFGTSQGCQSQVKELLGPLANILSPSEETLSYAEKPKY